MTFLFLDKIRSLRLKSGFYQITQLSGVLIIPRHSNHNLSKFNNSNTKRLLNQNKLILILLLLQLSIRVQLNPLLSILLLPTDKQATLNMFLTSLSIPTLKATTQVIHPNTTQTLLNTLHLTPALRHLSRISSNSTTS